MYRFNCLICAEVGEAKTQFAINCKVFGSEAQGLDDALTDWWTKTDTMCEAKLPIGMASQDICDVSPEVQAMEIFEVFWPEMMENFDWRKLKEAHG